MNRRKSPLDTYDIDPQVCSVDLRLQILHGASFFTDLTQNQLKQINGLFVEKGYVPGETIYYTGDAASRLYAVATGRVKLFRHTPAGKNILLDIMTQGEFFGSLSPLLHDEYPETAQAHTTACILSIGAEEFRKIMHAYPSVAIKVLDTTSERLKNAYEMVRQLSAHSVEERIAHILLRLAEKLGEKREEGLLIQAPLSREELAEMAGTTTETASRLMSQFQKNGLVSSGRQWVAITDRDGLADLVEDEFNGTF